MYSLAGGVPRSPVGLGAVWVCVPAISTRCGGTSPPRPGGRARRAPSGPGMQIRSQSTKATRPPGPVSSSRTTARQVEGVVHVHGVAGAEGAGQGDAEGRGDVYGGGCRPGSPGPSRRRAVRRAVGRSGTPPAGGVGGVALEGVEGPAAVLVGEEGEVGGGHAGGVDQDDLARRSARRRGGGRRRPWRRPPGTAPGRSPSEYICSMLVLPRRRLVSTRVCPSSVSSDGGGALVEEAPAAVGRAGVLELPVRDAGAPARAPGRGARAGRPSCRRRRVSSWAPTPAATQAATACGVVEGLEVAAHAEALGGCEQDGGVGRAAPADVVPHVHQHDRPPGGAGGVAQGVLRRGGVAHHLPAALPGAPGQPAGGARGRRRDRRRGRPGRPCPSPARRRRGSPRRRWRRASRAGRRRGRSPPSGPRIGSSPVNCLTMLITSGGVSSACTGWTSPAHGAHDERRRTPGPARGRRGGGWCGRRWSRWCSAIMRSGEVAVHVQGHADGQRRARRGRARAPRTRRRRRGSPRRRRRRAGRAGRRPSGPSRRRAGSISSSDALEGVRGDRPAGAGGGEDQRHDLDAVAARRRRGSRPRCWWRWRGAGRSPPRAGSLETNWA